MHTHTKNVFSKYQIPSNFLMFPCLTILELECHFKYIYALQIIENIA